LKKSICKNADTLCDGKKYATVQIFGGDCIAYVGQYDQDTTLDLLDEKDPKKGVRLTYKNGKEYSIFENTYKRQATFEIFCDEKVDANDLSKTPIAFTEERKPKDNPGKDYSDFVFSIRTPYACPGFGQKSSNIAGGLGIGGIILIVFVACFILTRCIVCWRYLLCILSLVQ
jgi:hypothetical protein